MVYPNPASSQITLENPFLNSIATVQIFDSNGKEISYFHLNTKTNNVDISNYAFGNYFVLFSTMSMKVNSRFTKVE